MIEGVAEMISRRESRRRDIPLQSHRLERQFPRQYPCLPFEDETRKRLRAKVKNGVVSSMECAFSSRRCCSLLTGIIANDALSLGRCMYEII